MGKFIFYKPSAIRINEGWFNFIFSHNILASEVYFDLSDKEIQIETDFNGKEIIIFGTLRVNEDTIIAIEGPNKDVKMMKKERILGFWFNTKKVIYKKIPSVFFLSLGVIFTYFAVDYYTEIGRLNTNLTIISAGNLLLGTILLLTAILLYTLTSVVREKNKWHECPSSHKRSN